MADLIIRRVLRVKLFNIVLYKGLGWLVEFAIRSIHIADFGKTNTAYFELLFPCLFNIVHFLGIRLLQV